MVKIVMGVVLALVSVGMLLYLVPMPNTPLDAGSDGLADVAGLRIATADVQRELDTIQQRQPIPQQLKGFYANQIFDQMVFTRLLEVEAGKMGISITKQEVANQISSLLPNLYPNGKFVGYDQYAAMVQQYFGLDVPSFEDRVRQSLLQQKFRRLVTAGVAVSPQEVRQEYLRRNEKVKIDYALIDPSALGDRIKPADSDLQTWYNNHKAEYQVLEQRSARYLLLDQSLLTKNTVIPDSDLQAYYQNHIDLYKLPDRVHAEHILFMTVGKTDAEIAEIRKKAEAVLAQVRKGGDFAKLAKENSEDPGSKNKGGDLGWIVRGQTVPQFEQAAFTLPVGAVSDLVQTQYGFHIIKILGKETAHTTPFSDVRAQILQNMLADKVQQEAGQISDQMADIVRQSSRQTLEAVENALGPQAKPSLTLGQTGLVNVTQQIIPGLGNSTDARDAIFAQSPGQLSLPIHVQQGYAILEVAQIVPTHQGAFAEVKDRVQADYVKLKTVELAANDARQLAAAVKQGQKLDAAAKSLGLKTGSADFARTGTVAGLPARQFLSAFTAAVGEPQGPRNVGGKWIVYEVTDHEAPSEADFERQRASIQQELLTDDQDNAFEAFHRALEDQMKTNGTLKISTDNLKRLTNPGQS